MKAGFLHKNLLQKTSMPAEMIQKGYIAGWGGQRSGGREMVGFEWSFVGPRAQQTKAPDARWQSAGVPQNVPSELAKVVARLAVLVEVVARGDLPTAKSREMRQIEPATCHK